MSIACILLDTLPPKYILESNPIEANRILSLIADKCEKVFGARHPMTISTWVRKGQAVKRIIELFPQNRKFVIHDGIRCLNKALRANEISPTNPSGLILDHSSFTHHLLSILYLWNGEPGKAVEVSREGIQCLERVYGLVHPRYLNSAFLHAKLLEGYAASVKDPIIAVESARESLEVLETILDCLLDLSTNQIDDSEFKALFGPDVMDTELDMKRKLAITALILKLNIWLLDASVASDLLDLVVSSQMSGTRGVLVLPNRTHVKKAVSDFLETKNTKGGEDFLPVLELSSKLPIQILTCCNMALVAKSKGTRVSDWFEAFRLNTVRQMGQADNSQDDSKDLLITLFTSFVYIAGPEGTYIGPLSFPLVPRKTSNKAIETSHQSVYSDWELSSTLYCIEHGLRPIQSN